jgi:hypothetical protein
MSFVSNFIHNYLIGEVKFYFILVACVSAFFMATAFHSASAAEEYKANVLVNNSKNTAGCSCGEKKISEVSYPHEWLSEYSLAPWESMGTDVREVCSAVLPYRYEWGVQYNNRGPILRVTCNTWNTGWRVCSYPQYATGDAQPFDWGGVCWIWNTTSTWDNTCTVAYHSYYYYNAAGKLYMAAGNGCDQLPTVYRRLLW